MPTAAMGMPGRFSSPAALFIDMNISVPGEIDTVSPDSATILGVVPSGAMHIRRVPPQLESLGRILDLPLPARLDRDAGADLASGRPFPLGDGGIAKPAGGGERQRIKTTVTPAAGFLSGAGTKFLGVDRQPSGSLWSGNRTVPYCRHG